MLIKPAQVVQALAEIEIFGLYYFKRFKNYRSNCSPTLFEGI